MENLQNTISHIWNVFVTSNTFNFVVFIALFALLFKKVNFKGMLEGMQKKVETFIENAKKEKEEALQLLNKAESSVANLDNELKDIVEDAEKSAQVISKKVLTEAEKQIESIEANATRIIKAEEKQLVAKLEKSASKASVEVAKTHIKNVLGQTPSLHEKYINESIDELDRLSF